MAFEVTISRMLETAPIVSEGDLVDPTHPSNVSILSDPNALLVPDLGSLRDALIGVANHLGFLDVDALVEHEGQHGSAWEKVARGNMQHCYGLRLFRVLKSSGIISVSVNPLHIGEAGNLSALEKASVAAHPTEPSRADKALITAYGYRDIEEVGERAIDNNRHGLKHVPVPLSYRHPTDWKVFDLGQTTLLKPRVENTIRSTPDVYSLTGVVSEPNRVPWPSASPLG